MWKVGWTGPVSGRPRENLLQEAQEHSLSRLAWALVLEGTGLSRQQQELLEGKNSIIPGESRAQRTDRHVEALEEWMLIEW